jgi:hypothetical protein
MIPAPAGAYILSVEERHPDGSNSWHEIEVVAFDDTGTPLVVDDHSNTGLVTPVELAGAPCRWSLSNAPHHATTPAEPGWYALYTIRYDEGDEFERLPVIAWRTTSDEYDGSATIIGHDDCGVVRPLDAVAYARTNSNEDLVGFFHPARYPEPEAS